MLCEFCGKYAATTHIKTNINGKTEERHLCANCAQKSGYEGQFGFDSLFGSLFGETVKAGSLADTRKRCEGCGITFDQITRAGKVGCDKCYESFLEQLIPSLQRIHGKSKHTGKIPSGRAKVIEEKENQNELERLRADLKECIEKQDFEQAAVIRDKIREREGNQNG